MRKNRPKLTERMAKRKLALEQEALAPANMQNRMARPEGNGGFTSGSKGLGTPKQSVAGQLTRNFQPISRSQTVTSSLERTDSRAVKLMVDPFQFINYVAWDCIQTFNEHGVLTIKGLIAEENREKYVEMASRETWVCAKALDENDAEIILFQGILTNLTVDSIHQYHTMRIEVKTGSYLLDQMPHTRTFQPDETTYQQVINTCLQASDGQMVMREKQDVPTGKLTVQYEETDWTFINRLAHRLGIVVIPEYQTQGKRILLGLVRSRERELLATRYAMSSGTSDKDSLIHFEQGVYHVSTRAIYELGEPVSFQGRRLVITKVERYLEGSELMHSYTLCSLKSAYEQPQPHNQIKGVSMRGRVTAVKKASVQVQLHEDENRRRSGNRWFDYATVYSTPDGTGWFVQPEVSDEIRLIFPNADEAGAYVASSVHLETAGGRTNPDHKSWKNKQNKEVLLTPDAIHVKNNQGLSIELDDAKGITLASHLGIFIESEGQLQLTSENAGVTVYGDRGVTMIQGSAQIRMKDAIDIAGGKINMN
ncbi:MAG: phage late control D family protein [Defluviitaleaceae bacterium]|nr:phage late control D family protein [Defluviitaleaceae bacterium]